MSRRSIQVRVVLSFIGLVVFVVAGCGGSLSSSVDIGISSSVLVKTTKAASSAPASSGGAQTIHLAVSPLQLKFNVFKLKAKVGKVTLVMVNLVNFSHGVSIEGHKINK